MNKIETMLRATLNGIIIITKYKIVSAIETTE